MKEFSVDYHNAGQKAEKFVKKALPEAPLGYIYKAFRKKDIKANGHWIKKDYIVQEGDVIRIYITDEKLNDFLAPKAVSPSPFPYLIVYESEKVLIVDKPSGVMVVGEKGDTRSTLAQKVWDYLCYKGEYDPEKSTFAPSPAHRLDRNTSGLVVFGKTDEALKVLTEAFKERKEITKKYWALVTGKMEKDEGEISYPLIKDSKKGVVRIGKMEEGAKSALTLYKKLEQFGDCALLECELITGRTHQIRVHLASVNHPILGDGKYGDFSANREFRARYNLDHQFLRAKELSFGSMGSYLSELNGKTFSSSLSKEEEEILNKLRKESKR